MDKFRRTSQRAFVSYAIFVLLCGRWFHISVLSFYLFRISLCGRNVSSELILLLHFIPFVWNCSISPARLKNRSAKRTKQLDK